MGYLNPPWEQQLVLSFWTAVGIKSPQDQSLGAWGPILSGRALA